MSECNLKNSSIGNPCTPVAMAFAQSINSREPIQAGRSHCGRSASSLFHQQRAFLTRARDGTLRVGASG